MVSESSRNLRKLFTVAALTAVTLTSATAFAQQRGRGPGAQATDNEAKEDAGVPVPPETVSQTKHDWTAGARPVHYTATAGNLVLKNEKNEPYVSMFYVAYTEDGVAAKNRPVTFLYNGGPGSATVWLHMGSLGPIRVVTESPKATGPAPFEWVPNQYSLLDKSDLVFIDAPQTGYSRVVGKGNVKDVAGVDQDVEAFEKFIIRYLTVNNRWLSPKYLFGESYGTPRSAALVAKLNDDGVEFNGVTLLSSILNYYAQSPGFDIEPEKYLPTYASIAWYYNKVPHTGTQMEWIEKAREFSRGPYAEALQQGDMLPKAQFDDMAAKVAAFTGLPVEYVKEAKLRISPTRFRKELLRNDAEILGRYDARFEGEDMDSAGENPGYDPSDTGISGVYIGAFHDYIVSELKYTTNENYNLQGPGINQNWDWTHHPSGMGGYGRGGRGMPEPDTVLDLSDAMRKEPHLQVFSANGIYDLATPFFGTEHDLGQMMLPENLTHNVHFGYYPAGHMVYLNVEALKEMHADLDKFYDATDHH
jgi:carboxypeptidase C (cathepsin A)